MNDMEIRVAVYIIFLIVTLMITYVQETFMKMKAKIYYKSNNFPVPELFCIYPNYPVSLTINLKFRESVLCNRGLYRAAKAGTYQITFHDDYTMQVSKIR